MGLFDDLMGVAKEFNDIKAEVTNAVGGVKDDLLGLKDEASSAVTQLKDEATTVKDEFINKASDVTGQSKDQE